MSCLAFTRRGLAAVIFAILMMVSVPVMCADDGTIALRLEESEPTQVQQEGSPLTQIVPPTASRLTAPPAIKGASAILMDVDTGHIICSKNPHARLPNASTTKIMTAILLIEHCKMEDRIRASKNASLTPYTSLHLKPGETITVKDLLTGMLIRSANDAAVAAAEHIGGSTARFAVLMNKKARQIGCVDTHFVTPNGLYDPKHYTSAYDLCLMARYAFRYPIFNEAISTRKYFLNSRSINKNDLAVYARSKFLKDYPGADGVKSGYVKQARHCYVGSATRDGWRLVAVVLRSENANADTAAIMDYGFTNFQPVTVVRADEKCTEAKVTGGGKPTVPAVAVQDLKVPVPRTGGKVTAVPDLTPVQAPVKKGTKLGKLRALVDGREVASVELRAGDDVEISMARKVWSVTKWCGFLVACLMGGRYGTTFAKGTRRRRRRFSAPMRDYNSYR